MATAGQIVERTPERTAGSAWTYKVPVEHIWVHAEVVEISLSSEGAMDFLKGSPDIISRVRVDERRTDSGEIKASFNAEMMRACCPFCEEGCDQLLQSDRWLYVHDFYDSSKIYCVPMPQPLYKCGVWVDHPSNETAACLTHLFFGFLDEETDGADGANSTGPSSAMPAVTNPYGIDFEGVAVLDPRQQRLPAAEVPLVRRTFGIPDFFAGTYRCKHCGRAFGVVFHSDNTASSQEDPEGGLGEEMVRQEEMRVLDTLADHALRSQEPYNTITVKDDESAVVVALSIGGVEREFAFDTQLGLVRIDGKTWMPEGYPESLFMHPFVTSGIFEQKEVVEHLASRLPSLPQGISWEGSERTVFLLLATNRFIGYPASFYDDVFKEYPSTFRGAGCLFNEFYPLLSRFPRRYEDIGACYALTGLPEKKSLKRILYSRPALLFTLMGKPGLPFENTDVLCRFLALPKSIELFRALHSREMGLVGWRCLTRAKGELAVLRLLSEMPCGEIDELGRLLGEVRAKCSVADVDAIGRTPLKRLKPTLKSMVWQAEHPNVDLDGPYDYSEEQRFLEGSVSAFTFTLPRCPRDFLKAAEDLHNCMASPAMPLPMSRTRTTILICKGEQTVGGITVTDGSRVTEALLACNVPLDCNPEVAAAVKAWAQEKKLSIEV